jgi:hypothetical protein
MSFKEANWSVFGIVHENTGLKRASVDWETDYIVQERRMTVLFHDAVPNVTDDRFALVFRIREVQIIAQVLAILTAIFSGFAHCL